MILILTPNIKPDSNVYQQLIAHLSRLPDIQLRVHREQGVEQMLTEIHLIGNTSAIPTEDVKDLPGVERVVRVSEEYRRPTAIAFQLSGTALWPGHTARIRGIVCGRYGAARRVDDEGAARSRPGLYANGRLQTAHQSVFISGPWQELSALRF